MMQPGQFPNMGAAGGAADALNPASMMAQMQKAWASFGVPSGMAPTLSVEELDKRIADLRAVEQWLSMNLTMLQTSVQGLEVQRGTLAALQSLSQAASDASGPGAAAVKEAMAKATGSAETTDETNSVDAPNAWWNMLQQQFGQIAEATLAAGTSATAKSPKPKQPAKKARSKTSSSAKAKAKRPRSAT